MKNKIKKYLIIFSVSLNIGFIIAAGYTLIRYKLPYKGHYSRYSYHIRSFDKLNLSAEQKKQIDQLVKDYITASKRIRYSSNQQAIKTYALMEKPGLPDREVLDKYLKAEQFAESNKEKIKLRHLIDIKRVLTDDQATSFFRNLAELKKAHMIKLQQKP